MREAVLGPLRQVYGVSDKVLSVALSSLLLGGGRGRARWAEVGGSLIAIDTLVHNFLARTGILARANAGHPYGPACYRPGGCATIIEVLASAIDAREFNPSFPPIFPHSCRARSGGTAPRRCSTSATAIGSTIANRAATPIAGCFGSATGFPSMARP
jgi:hypothetical protein